MNEDKLRARMAQVLQRLYGPSLGAALDWDSEPEKTRQMYLNDADAVIRELDLAIPCTATGCRMRQIAKRHAEASSRLEMPDE